MRRSVAEGGPGVESTDSTEAIVQIQQLAYRYAYAVDTRDLSLLESLWTPSVDEVDPPLMNIRTVQREWRAWFDKGMTVHHVTNHLVDVHSPTTATGVVYCVAQLDLVTHFVDRSIMYVDTYDHADGSWRFATRKHMLWFGRRSSENPLDQPAAEWPDGYGSGTLPRAVMPHERHAYLRR